MRVCLILLALCAPLAAEHLGKSLDEWRGELGSDVRLERLMAARAIGEMAIARDKAAAKALFDAMEHEDSGVRYWAVVAVGQMGKGAREAERRLLTALDDPTPEVRVWAAFALAPMGRDEAALEVLIRELGNEEKGARLQAAHALDELGDLARPAIAALQEATSDEFDYVGRVSRHALWELGARPCPYKECGE